jgi:hypothetical protein
MDRKREREKERKKERDRERERITICSIKKSKNFFSRISFFIGHEVFFLKRLASALEVETVDD